MKGSNLTDRVKVAEGCWTHDCDHGDARSPERVCETFHPALVISLRDYNRVPLKEFTYKDMAAAIDPGFKNQGFRAWELDGDTIKVEGFEGDTMNFSINSSEYDKNKIKYICSIQFLEWDEVGQDQELTPMEKAWTLL